MPRFGGLGTAFGRMGAGGKVPADVSGVSAPTNSVAPVISGNTQVTQTLTTTDGTWTGSPTFTYQWRRAGVDIASATANTYVLVEADAGAAITCNVTGTNGGGNATAGSNTLTIDVYAVYVTNVVDATDVASGASYSGGVWNGVSIGVAAANRKIALVTSCRSNNAAMTIGTQTVATNNTAPASNAANNLNVVYIKILDLTTGATADIVTPITGTGSSLRIGVGVWAIYGAASSTPTDTKSAITDAGAMSLTVSAKGVAIGGSVGSGGTSCTVTGMIKRYDTAMEGGVLHAGADLNSNAGGSISINFDWSVAPTDPIAACASFA